MSSPSLENIEYLSSPASPPPKRNNQGKQFRGRRISFDGSPHKPAAASSSSSSQEKSLFFESLPAAAGFGLPSAAKPAAEPASPAPLKSRTVAKTKKEKPAEPTDSPARRPLGNVSNSPLASNYPNGMPSPGAIAHIFSKPPFSPDPAEKAKYVRSPLTKHDFGSPGINQPSQLRKRHLKKAQISSSPFKNTQIEEFGAGPFSQRLIESQKELDVTAGRNGALVLFSDRKTKRYGWTQAYTAGAPSINHAEGMAVGKVPSDADIHSLYTARKPCQCGANCHCKLKATLPEKATVIYSADHVKDKKRQREIEADFQALQEGFGIRVASKKRKKDKANKAPKKAKSDKGSTKGKVAKMDQTKDASPAPVDKPLFRSKTKGKKATSKI